MRFIRACFATRCAARSCQHCDNEQEIVSKRNGGDTELT